MILGLPYALALALIAGILDLVPTVGALLAGIIIGIVALSVSLGAQVAFVIVVVVCQQVENYLLQPTTIGKAANISGFTMRVSVLVFGALFGIVGAIIGVRSRPAILDHRRRDHGLAACPHRCRRRRSRSGRLTSPRPAAGRRTAANHAICVTTAHPARAQADRVDQNGAS